MVDAVACLPGVRSLVIDGELVACDAAGLPDYYRLHFRRHDRSLCVWAFDLLHHNGRDLRELALLKRKARLEKLILAAKCQLAALLGKLRRWPTVTCRGRPLGLEGVASRSAAMRRIAQLSRYGLIFYSQLDQLTNLAGSSTNLYNVTVF
jgi:bifunctional non-homologous end joining protein LigD